MATDADTTTRVRTKNRPRHAWSNGGAADLSNLTMLCQTHNRAKGNK